MQAYSVLMSVYKNEKADYLRLSLESIFAQTLPTDDFVLVCDGPLTQELDEVIGEFQNRYPSILQVVRFTENRGLGPALNDGLKECKNELVARMDSDDYAPPKRCEQQLQAFAENPDLAVVGGNVEEFEGAPDHILSKKEMPLTHDEIIRYAKLRNPFNHPSVMYKKSTVLNSGGYPPLHLHEDYGLWIKIFQSNALTCNLPQTLCLMRVDSGLYARRGGFKYLRIAAKFRSHLHKIGFSNFFEMMYSIIALTVSCLIPTGLRKIIYKKILRK